MKLLIRNLARNTTEAELLAMFQQYGAVQSCNLVMDEKTKESKGFAFIEMPQRCACMCVYARVYVRVRVRVRV